MKGLLVSIYKSGDIEDCTNGGISSKKDSAILTGEGIPPVSTVTEESPELVLVRRVLCGQEYLHAQPAHDPTGTGWMFGGNFIHTTDSRFPNRCPIAIHDRQECGGPGYGQD